MTTDTLAVFRAASYEIAEAIAPTWERRREDVERVSTPIREWMLRELRPREGDTVLELAAGVGETGFEVAATVGERGQLITTDFSPAMVDAARRRGAELGVNNVKYKVMDAERARRRLGRRCALPVRIHADGGPRRGARRDPPRPMPGRATGAGGMGNPEAEPLLRDHRAQPRPAWPHPAA